MSKVVCISNSDSKNNCEAEPCHVIQKKHDDKSDTTVIVQEEEMTKETHNFVISPPFKRAWSTILEEIDAHSVDKTDNFSSLRLEPKVKDEKQDKCFDDDGDNPRRHEIIENGGHIHGNEIIEQNLTFVSPASEMVGKTILDDIDACSSVLHTKETEDLSKSPSLSEMKSRDIENSTYYDEETNRDKENTSISQNSTVHSTLTHSQFLKSDKIIHLSESHQESDCFGWDSKDLKTECQKGLAEKDPFSLSADEEFSPKVYKPILKRISMDEEKPTTNLTNLKNPALANNEDNAGQNNEVTMEDITDCLPGRKKLKPSHRVAYVHSAELIENTNRLFRIKGRANFVHSLIHMYGILQYVEVLKPRCATESEIHGFHCPDYVNFLKGICDDDDNNSETIIDEAEEYGLSYDCPLQKDCFKIASLISGGTITAAEALCEGTADTAINWCGGWHHAKRDSASGFCYLNDIVLGILKLRERFDKVLYIDIDLHHGDGVEEAFSLTPKVMTVSFHKCAPGFFPGSGNVEDSGSGRGKYYTLNIPLMDGIKDSEFYFVFSSVIKSLKEKFQPDAVVMQCGADTLAEDPMVSFNMTHIGIAKCVCLILTWNLPTLLLGGGGYHFANTAKCWTFITAMVAGKKLPVDIPEHENLLEYGPSYELTTSHGYRKNCNSKEYLRQLLVKVHRNLIKI